MKQNSSTCQYPVPCQMVHMMMLLNKNVSSVFFISLSACWLSMLLTGVVFLRVYEWITQKLIGYGDVVFKMNVVQTPWTATVINNDCPEFANGSANYALL